MATILQLLGLTLIALGILINWGTGWALGTAGVELVLVGVAHELRPRGNS
jgi:hypothetical protein